MKFNLFNLFIKSNKEQQVEETFPDLKLDLKKISKQREIPIIQSGNFSNQLKVKKTTSLSNVKETFSKLKRSSSFSRLSKKHKNSQTHNSKSKTKTSQYHKDFTHSIPEEEDYSGDTSIFDQVRTSSLNSSSFINITPDNQDYTDYYNNLYMYYCQDESNKESISAITSLDWNKENIPPFDYPLSESKTPNYSITQPTPSLQHCDTENPFLDTNMLTPPHRLFLKNKENNYLIPSDDKEILYYTSYASTSCKSTPSNCLQRKPSFLRSSASPRISIPLLPNVDMRSPVSTRSVNLLNTLSALANDNNPFDIDEENSLFEALNSTELISCSKVKFVSYNS